MIITSQVFDNIYKAFISNQYESGGLLGSRDGVICSFLFDIGNGSSSEYAPNVSLFNDTLKTWAESNIKFAGIIHSHPNDCRCLSFEDEKTIHNICASIKVNNALFFPILTISNGSCIITPYKYENGSITKDNIKILR